MNGYNKQTLPLALNYFSLKEDCLTMFKACGQHPSRQKILAAVKDGFRAMLAVVSCLI